MPKLRSTWHRKRYILLYTERRQTITKVNIRLIDLPEEFHDLSPRRQRQIAGFLEKELRKAQLDFLEQSLDLLFAIPALVLKDKFGFGRERQYRFMSACETWLKAVHDDPNTMSEIVELAKQEVGYTFETV